MNKNSKVLVTGASGFLGANFTKFLNNKNKDLSIFINKKSKIWRIEDIVKNLDVHYVDIKNKKIIFEKIKKIKPDYVYHFAANGVYPFQRNIEKIIETNIIGTTNILHALEEHGIKRLINIGSGFEYGSVKGMIKETDCVNPITPYAITKNTQTLFVKYFSDIKHVPSITLRVFTPYGRLESKDRLISDIMISMIKKNPLYLSSQNSYRDFVFMDDVIDALKKAAVKPKVEGEIINISGGKPVSIKKIVDMSLKLVRKKPKIIWNKKESRPTDKFQKTSYADLKKAEKLLDWKPSTSLEKGLQKSYSWYKKNLDMY